MIIGKLRKIICSVLSSIFLSISMNPVQATEVSEWRMDEWNDGFTKSIIIKMKPVQTGNFELFEDMQIACKNKKLSASIFWEGPINRTSFEFNRNEVLVETGKLQLRFDNKAMQTWKWNRRGNHQIRFQSPETFLQEFLRAKKRIRVKITFESKYDVLEYPKGNLNDFRKKFAKYGCKF